MQKPDVKLSTCVDGVNDEVEYWMPTKPLSDSADFVLTPQDWDLIFSSVQGRYIKNKNWSDIIRKYLKQSNGYCSFVFKCHRWNISDRSNIVFSCSGKCKFNACGRLVKIKVYDKTTKCFHINYSGIVKHYADDTSGCYLKGSRRNELKAKLENVNPRRQYLENLQTLAEDVFESGTRCTECWRFKKSKARSAKNPSFR